MITSNQRPQSGPSQGSDLAVLDVGASGKEPWQNSELAVRGCVFSVDVEDWFHILDLASGPKFSEWPSLPSRVEADFLRLLDLFERKAVKTTCFFLGWVAQRFPALVTEAARRGHEIASHGYSHELVYRMQPEGFLDDIRKAKNILEDISGTRVKGYRAPGFSCTEDVPWFFEKIVEAGYLYDSSVFPGSRGHGGMKEASLVPSTIHTRTGSLVEVPITLGKILGRRLCFFGGGYLRLFPYSLVRTMARRVLAEDRPVVFFVHPREIDPAHPRLAMPLARRFKCYVNLKSTERKIAQILDDFPVTTFSELIKTYLPK